MIKLMAAATVMLVLLSMVVPALAEDEGPESEPILLPAAGREATTWLIGAGLALLGMIVIGGDAPARESVVVNR